MEAYKYEDGLETQRLLTRFLTIDDAAIWAEFLGDKEAGEFLPQVAGYTPEQNAVVWIERQLNRYDKRLYGLQALLDKHTGEFIGQCGLITQDIDGRLQTEVGYHIRKQYWGKGYAPEAAKKFISYGFENGQADSIISIIDIHNTKSQSVAGKNGLKRDKQVRWRDSDVYIYRIDKKDWDG